MPVQFIGLDLTPSEHDFSHEYVVRTSNKMR